MGRLWVPSTTTMSVSASGSRTRGREQHPSLTSAKKIKVVQDKMYNSLFEMMQFATVLGISCLVVMSTGIDGEETVHSDDLSMIKAMRAVTDKVAAGAGGMSPVTHAVFHGCEKEVFGRACRWKSVTTVKSLKETVGRVHVSVVDDSKSLWLV